jgi:hypothetical protein
VRRGRRLPHATIETKPIQAETCGAGADRHARERREGETAQAGGARGPRWSAGRAGRLLDRSPQPLGQREAGARRALQREILVAWIDAIDPPGRRRDGGAVRGAVARERLGIG